MSKSCVLILTLSLSVVSALALPRQVHEVEDLSESEMHPDFPFDRQSSRAISPLEIFSEYWLDQSKEQVIKKTSRDLNRRKAKNIILFLGDGMSLTTIAATRVYIGGEEQRLSFEDFPITGLSKTYSVDRIVPDSATTSTAYLCGVKANYGTIGVNAKIERDDCTAAKDTSNYVFSIGKWAMDARKSAGLVTTARVTHASPAGVYAHTAEREWENDSEVKTTCGEGSGIDDIAVQLIHGEVGSRLKVMMGGGKRNFLDSFLDPIGRRSDGKDLISEYKAKSPQNAYVETRDELMSLNPNSSDRLLGLFQNSHMKYNLETIDEDIDQPSLAEMTQKAIEFMQDNENGFFLFVEGARIDMAHHVNEAKLSLDETQQFSEAIALARKLTSEDDTLIIVTSDHSHVLSYSGYAKRNKKITGKAGTAEDDRPYMIMTYPNGPSSSTYFKKGSRVDPTSTNKSKVHSAWPSLVPLEAETHGGEDVGVFASGPWSHLFSGVYEQNAIPHMMAYAACIGDGLKMCDQSNAK